MKKILPILVAAASIASASAAGKIVPGLASRPTFSQKERMATMKERSQKISARKAVKNHAPKRIDDADFEGQTIVTSAPNGTLTHYSASTYAFYSSYYYDTEGTVDGVIADVTITEDGKAYWLNPLSGAQFDSYIVGEVDGNKITFTFPQFIGEEDFYGFFELYYYAALFTPYEEDGYTDFEEADDQVLVMTINEDGTITQEGDAYLGLGDYDEDYGFYFDGYADSQIVLTPFNDVAVAAPASATFENWIIEEEYNDVPTWILQGAVVGDDFYFKGLSQDYPEMTFKGHLESDGTNTYVSVPAAQFVGATAYRYNYLLSGTLSYEYDEEYEEEVGTVDVNTDAYKFVYDAENHRLTAPAEDDILFINEGTAALGAIAVAVNPTIYKQGEISDYTPAAATDLYLDDSYWDYYDQMLFSFVATCQTVNGDLLAAANCSYEVFVNGDLFVFTTDEYTEFDQNYTEIPFNYTDDYDLEYTIGTDTHYIYFNDDSMDSIGVRMIYTNPNTGEKFYSETATLTLNDSGVESVSAEASPVVAAEYFDLNGRRVDASATGVMVVRLTHANGTTSVAKRVVR
jgi:hypothetical protein